MEHEKFAKELEGFRERQFERVKSLEIEDLNISLYEAKSLGFETPEEMIKWEIHSKMSMSSRHLKGRFLEDLVKTISKGALEEEKFSNERKWDIAIEREDVIYLIDIKSSLNPLNLRQITSSKTQDIQTRLGKEHKWVLGTPRRLETDKEKIKENYSGDIILSGKEFWNFITDEEDGLAKITDLLYDSNKNEPNLNELIEKKSSELAEEWKIRFGEEVINEETVERFF